MARTPRLDSPGLRHHVMSRTANGLEVFTNDAECALFMETLEQLPGLFGVRIHAYALMPNHFHLLLETPQGNLAQAMQYLGLVFTQAYNRANRREGALWRGRYNNRVVLDDAYWRFLLAYVHLNPVKAILVRKPEEAMWTSHTQYLGLRSREPWLTTEDMLGYFGSREALQTYVMDVRARRCPIALDFKEEDLWKAPSTEQLPLPQPLPNRSMGQALQDVADLFGMAPHEVLRGSRSPKANLPRWLAAWWLRHGTGSTQSQVAAYMDVSRPRVSQLQGRLMAATTDSEVSAMMAQLRALIEVHPLDF